MIKKLIVIALAGLIGGIVFGQSRRDALPAQRQQGAYFNRLHYVVCVCGNELAKYKYDGNGYNIYTCDKCNRRWANKAGTNDLTLVEGSAPQRKADHQFDINKCFRATFANGTLTIHRGATCRETLYIPVSVWACRTVTDNRGNKTLRRSHHKESRTIVLSEGSDVATMTVAATDSVFIMRKGCCHRAAGQDNPLPAKAYQQ